MANETPPPPPPTLTVPPGVMLLLQLLGGLTGSPWLRSILTALATVFGTLHYAKTELPAAMEKHIREMPKKLLPLPQIVE